jgi:hypothetical protein
MDLAFTRTCTGNTHRDQGMQTGDRASIADAKSLNAALFDQSIDALASSSLSGKGMEQETLAVERDALDACAFPIDVYDAAIVFGELFLLARLCRVLRMEQRAAGSGSVGSESRRDGQMGTLEP